MGRTALAVLSAVLVAVGLATGSCSSGTEDPPDIAAAMSQTIDEWQDAVLAQDTGRIVALYSDDAVWHDEALEETLSVATGWSIFSMVQDVVEVETEAASGDTAVVRWTFEGSNWGTTGLSVLTFDDEGTIVAETAYYDCAQSPVPIVIGIPP